MALGVECTIPAATATTSTSASVIAIPSGVLWGVVGVAVLILLEDIHVDILVGSILLGESTGLLSIQITGIILADAMLPILIIELILDEFLRCTGLGRLILSEDASEVEDRLTAEAN